MVPPRTMPRWPRVRRWVVALGKTPVLVRDAPGFVVNRVLAPYLDEAVRLVAEGLGTAALDGAMRKFGMPMGPLELLDQIGLDVASDVAASMAPVLAGRFPPNEGFARLRQSGWLGQKSGRGFYDHRGDKSAPILWPRICCERARLVSRWLGPYRRRLGWRRRAIAWYCSWSTRPRWCSKKA